jgi:hypothetical protein
MSVIHGTHSRHSRHGAHANHGPRFSASDRPLPPRTARTTLGARTRIAAGLAVVVGLMTLGIVAPTATLGLLLAVVVTSAVIGGMFQLADRGARSWGAMAHRTSHPLSRRATRRDA